MQKIQQDTKNISVKDKTITVYMGTDYSLKNIRTLGDLKTALYDIIENLPNENYDDKEINEVTMQGNTLSFIFTDGIPQ